MKRLSSWRRPTAPCSRRWTSKPRSWKRSEVVWMLGHILFLVTVEKWLDFYYQSIQESLVDWQTIVNRFNNRLKIFSWVPKSNNDKTWKEFTVLFNSSIMFLPWRQVKILIFFNVTFNNRSQLALLFFISLFLEVV